MLFEIKRSIFIVNKSSLVTYEYSRVNMKYILLLTLSLFICISAHAEERYLLSDEYISREKEAFLASDYRKAVYMCQEAEYKRLALILDDKLKKIIELLSSRNDHGSILRLNYAQKSWEYYVYTDKNYIATEAGTGWGTMVGRWALYLISERIIDIENILNEKPFNSNLIQPYRYAEFVMAGFPSSKFTNCMETSGNDSAALVSCVEEESKIQNNLLNYAYDDELEELQKLATFARDSSFCLSRYLDFVKIQRIWLNYREAELAFYDGLDRPDAKLRGMIWNIYANARRACQIVNILNTSCYAGL